MKLSQSSVKVLKNFSVINKSIWVDKGKKLTTVSPREQSIVAIADLDDEFPVSFGLLDIPQFLSAISNFDSDKYDIEFGEFSMKVKDGQYKLDYPYAEKRVIHNMPPEDLEMELPGSLIEFDITQKIWQNTVKMLHILGVDSFVLVGDGKNISLKAHTPKDPTSSVFDAAVGLTDKKFNLIFKGDYVGALLDGDYRVTVSDGLTLFKTANVSYYIAPDESSEYP